MGVPNRGVTNVGEVANTSAPEPVSSVTAVAKLALEGVAKNVAAPAPSPDTPVLIGSPVQLVKVPLVGVPSKGVTKVGDVANTNEPEPVSSVTAVAKLADDGVARKVATLDANPDTPVLIGNPVQLVNVPLVGVPNKGVTNVGDVANTAAPVPVSSVNVAAKLADDGVAKNVAMPVANPAMPVLTGNPVQLVNTPLVGVPKSGVTSVADVVNTMSPVPDVAIVYTPPVPETRSPRIISPFCNVPKLFAVFVAAIVVVAIYNIPDSV